MAAPGDLLTVLDPELAAAVSAAHSSIELCSPFVGPDTAIWLADAAASSSAKWTLLTELDPVAAAYGSLSIRGLRALLAAGVSIWDAGRLHAKVFLCDGAVGFAGSANLTSSGLVSSGRSNLELTVALTATQCSDAAAVLAAWLAGATRVAKAELDECERQARRIPVRVRRRLGRAAAAQEADVLLREAADGTVWVKALYYDAVDAARPWDPNGWVGSPDKGCPTFKTGDFLLIYAKYTGLCNAIVEVTGPTRFDPAYPLAQGKPPEDAERWPWITPVAGRRQVPVACGVPLHRLGLTGQSLRNGHCRMPVGGFPTAVDYLTA